MCQICSIPYSSQVLRRLRFGKFSDTFHRKIPIESVIPPQRLHNIGVSISVSKEGILHLYFSGYMLPVIRWKGFQLQWTLVVSKSVNTNIPDYSKCLSGPCIFPISFMLKTLLVSNFVCVETSGVSKSKLVPWVSIALNLLRVSRSSKLPRYRLQLRLMKDCPDTRSNCDFANCVFTRSLSKFT